MDNRLMRGVLVACGVALLFAGVAIAQGPMATQNVGPTQIEWAPAGSYGLQLTVSGPDGFHMDRTYGAGESAAFNLFDGEGNTLPAGSYTYELRAIPQLDQAARDALAAARESGVSVGALRKAGTLPVQIAPMTGAFSIRDGAIVLGGGNEAGPAAQTGGNQISTKDQVINDDLIVVGSACIGMDCNNGENFGFDTLRLKENNTRIKFDDTSTSGSFPNTDWQLTANDSSNGGANKFSIDDITHGRTPFTIEANTPSNSLYVDSSGFVGIGTSSPVLPLHAVDGNTPGLRLEQDGSSGFTAQTWDVAGNEANFFVRDITNGSKIPFKIIPGAPTNSLYVNASGNVGLGTASPSASLHVKRSDDTAKVLIEDTNGTESVNEMLELKNNGGVRYRLSNEADATQWDVNNDGNGDFAISLVGSGGNELEVEQDGDIGNCGNPDHDFVISTGPGCTVIPRSWIDAGDAMFTTTSSRTVKENFQVIGGSNILDKIKQIPVYHYDFINGPKDKIGLIAEDFHEVFHRGSDKEINNHEVQVAMWLAIQQLIAQNDALKSQVETLQKNLGEQ